MVRLMRNIPLALQTLPCVSCRSRLPSTAAANPGRMADGRWRGAGLLTWLTWRAPFSPKEDLQTPPAAPGVVTQLPAVQFSRAQSSSSHVAADPAASLLLSNAYLCQFHSPSRYRSIDQILEYLLGGSVGRPLSGPIAAPD
jgi:hypothetical protein